MTTFTSEDRKKAEENMSKSQEPIPFAGYVYIDQEDTEAMLREQNTILQREIHRLNTELNKLQLKVAPDENRS